MTVRAARDGDLTLNSVALECYVADFEQTYENSLSDAAGFCDDGPRQIVANNNWGANFSGPWDGASGAIDDTLFPLRTSTGFAYVFQPTGSTGAASTPEYSGTVVLRNYSIRGSLNGHWTYAAALAGNSSIIRDAT